MASLELWFVGANSPELLRISFLHPLLEAPIHSVRGKSSGAFRGASSFQWTPAVQALAIFFLRAKARKGDSPLLSGERGSAALSLDYALSKQTSWLLEMFGWDKSGQSIARRFIRRSNPNRKHKGPVVISLNKQALEPKDIRIFIDEEEITDGRLLEAFANSLETDWRPRNKSRTPNLSHHSTRTPDILSSPASICSAETLCGASFKNILRNEFRREIQKSLSRSAVFDKRHTERTVKQIANNPSLLRICGKPIPLTSSIDQDLSPAERVGVAQSTKWLKTMLTPDEPLRVATAVSTVAANALFLYLKHHKGFNLELNYQFIHALEISNRLINHELQEPPDICVMADAPAASMFNQGLGKTYRPLMLFPKTSHRVIGPRGTQTHAARKGYARYLLLRDRPSSASFYFDTLIDQKLLERKKQALEHKEPFEALSELRSGDSDLRSVMFFPYHALNCHFNSCCYLDDAENPSAFRDMVLLVHESLWEHTERLRALNIALRDAWIEIRANPLLLESLISLMIDDADYLKFLIRSGGLFHLQEFNPAA